ncbi:protein kinase domain-containing protein [Dactylosporangium sp. CA-152071]|uniref:protein kinase domain-containing protein n=1 Tax=Dactylosporangium sp. CA-152071 TaxID=3239933 RepID=UPI003D900792
MTDDDRFWVGPQSAPETYQLISCLGGGAEGEVWTAILPLSAEGRRNVAVKILPAGVPGQNYSQDSEEDWVRHGHLLRSISHPGLVRVLEVFTGPPRHRAGTAPAGAMRYVVMDHIEGVTMREWLDEHPDASVSARLRTLTTVASALDEMHSGAQTAVPVAHGDVKPSNIVIRPDGSTVLVDLGLTRLTDGGGRVGRSRPYAAPELFGPDGRTSPAADRFAFAATVVHTILGEPPPVGPHGGPDLAAVDQRLRTNPISARRPALVNQLMQALAAPPTHRPPNLRVWLGSLTDTLSQVTESGGGLGMLPPTFAAADQTATGTFMPPPMAGVSPLRAPVPAPTGGGGRRRTVVIAVAAAAVVLALAGGAVAYGMSGGDDPSDNSAKGTATATTAGAANPAPTTAAAPPSPTDTKAALTDEASSPASASADPSVSPSFNEGAAFGLRLSGNAAYEAGFIAGRTDMYYTATDIDINGKKSVSGWSSGFSCCNNGTTRVVEATIDINLSRKYTTLTGIVGIEDHGKPNVPIRVQVFADNTSVFDKQVTLGHPEDLKVTVTGCLRLRVVFTGQMYQAQAVVGDPKVFES